MDYFYINLYLVENGKWHPIPNCWQGKEGHIPGLQVFDGISDAVEARKLTILDMKKFNKMWTKKRFKTQKVEIVLDERGIDFL